MTNPSTPVTYTVNQAHKALKTHGINLSRPNVWYYYHCQVIKNTIINGHSCADESEIFRFINTYQRRGYWNRIDTIEGEIIHLAGDKLHLYCHAQQSLTIVRFRIQDLRGTPFDFLSEGLVVQIRPLMDGNTRCVYIAFNKPQEVTA